MNDSATPIQNVPIYSIEGLLGLRNGSIGNKLSDAKIEREDSAESEVHRRINGEEKLTGVGK